MDINECIWEIRKKSELRNSVVEVPYLRNRENRKEENIKN